MARDLNTGLGVDWNPGLQSGLVSNRGADMIHELGLACPKCRTSDVAANQILDGRAQTRSPNCPNCQGDGWLFRSALKIRGLAVSIRQQRNPGEDGIAIPGDMQFSIEPGFSDCGAGSRHVAIGDKFTATWEQPLDEGQTIIRGAAHMDDNVRLANNVSQDEDRLWYEPVSSLWCEDENGVTYQQGGDFTLGPGKVVTWTGGPVVGTKYTLKYTAYFEWLVYIPPQHRVDRDNRDLGPLVSLRKRHVAFVNSSPYITDADRVPLSRRVEC